MGSPWSDTGTRLHPTVSSDAQQDAQTLELHLGSKAVVPVAFRATLLVPG